jgi:hypothetical protein
MPLLLLKDALAMPVARETLLHVCTKELLYLDKETL